LIPKIKTVELTKPKLQLPPGTKLKAFTWKRIVLDHSTDPWEVAKEDLKGHDPKWKDKDIIWREIQENRSITFDEVQRLYPDKTKEIKEVKVEEIKEKARKFLPPEKEMSLSIVMARWPDPEEILESL